MNTDTPRTDAITIRPDHAVTSEYSALEIHAREIERENARMRAALEIIASGDTDARRRAEDALG
jgi:hypothetical protein